MSQSPDSADDRTGVQQYGQSWVDTLRLVRAGSSWSGRERNCVYLNVGANADADNTNQRFANVSAISGFDFPDDARSLALLDWDHDGDLDLWVRNRTAPRLRFLQNQTAQQTGNHAISIELQATAGNRHAIGAVVTLQTESDARPQTQSVRCGDAFLSQSSRRLHFGFRAPVRNATAQVLWPGGKRETFAGLASGQAVRLVQGTGKPDLLQRSVSKITSPSAPEPLPETSAARIILPAKLAFPNIAWLDENAVAADNPVENTNQVHSNQASSNRGTLVTLWTSSCVVCRQELTRFDTAKDELEKAGLRVIGVNIDLLLDGTADVDLSRVANPRHRYQTTVASAERITSLQNAIFDKYPEFVVPLSFLLDTDGNMLAIYRGAVEIETLLQDLTLANEGNDYRRKRMVPLPGTWFTKAATDSEFIEFAAARVFAFDQDQGLRYFADAIAAAESTERQLRLQGKLVATLRNLSRTASNSNDFATAERYLEQALNVADQSVKPSVLHDLAIVLASAGEFDKAESLLEQALQLRPDFTAAQQNLKLIRQRRSANENGN